MTTATLEERLSELKAQADKPSVPAPLPPAPSVRGGNVKPNRFGGKCEKCTRWVEPGAGSFRKGDTGWITFHVGDCPVADFPLDPSVDRPAPSSVENPVRHGIYTVDGDRGHATFRIWRQADDHTFAPGKDIIGVMLGTDNSRYTSIGFVYAGRVVVFKKFRGTGQWWQSYLDKLIKDPASALEGLNCRRCNRLLTNPDSHDAGIGPECAKLE